MLSDQWRLEDSSPLRAPPLLTPLNFLISSPTRCLIEQIQHLLLTSRSPLY